MPHSISFDATGNILSTGYFYGNADFDPSASNFTLSTTGGPGYSDIYILKLDGSGNFIWAKNIGSSTGNSQGHSIFIDASSNVYTTGEFRGTTDFDPSTSISNLISSGGSDIFISKLDANGNFAWAKKMGGIGQDYGNSIILDASNNIYIKGYFTGTSDFDPSISTYSINAVGGDQTFISKLDATGSFVWAKNIGGVQGISGYKSIALDASANIYTVGSYTGTADFDPNAGTYTLTSTGSSNIFISKLTNAGNFVWAKSISSIGSNPQSASIVSDAFYNVYISGYFGGTLSFGANTIPNLISPSGTNVLFQKLALVLLLQVQLRVIHLHAEAALTNLIVLVLFRELLIILGLFHQEQ
jgi:hypothetical protein